MPHPNRIVQDASEIVSDHMDAILKCFKPGALITVVVRHPDKPDGSKNMVLTNDTIDGAIEALQISKAPQTVKGEV
jgi:hypothetical protein